MSARDHAGQVVLVTGAAQGIGAAVAKLFFDRGAKLVLVDRQVDALVSLGATLDAVTITADLARADDVHRVAHGAVAARGPVDVLVNVAAVLRPGSALDVTDDDWQATFDVNTLGVMRLSRALAPSMVARGRGAIVSVGSNAATTPRTGMAAYAASKAATAQYMRCLALELAPHGVRCNLVSPGSTDTPMQHALWHDDQGATTVIRGSAETYRLGIPLQRIATPEDVAEAVCFLASPRARHITMHDLRVDGGATFDA